MEAMLSAAGVRDITSSFEGWNAQFTTTGMMFEKRDGSWRAGVYDVDLPTRRTPKQWRAKYPGHSKESIVDRNTRVLCIPTVADYDWSETVNRHGYVWCDCRKPPPNCVYVIVDPADLTNERLSRDHVCVFMRLIIGMGGPTSPYYRYGYANAPGYRALIDREQERRDALSWLER